METLEIIQSDYELERGKPMPSYNHSLLQSNLIFRLRLSYDETHSILSELSLSIESGDQRMVPDIAIYAKPPRYRVNDDVTTVTEVPLTTIEILSPSQALDDLTDKIARYLAAGVKSCWLVLPGLRTVAVSTAPGEYRSFDYPARLVDPATGLELELAKLFQ